MRTSPRRVLQADTWQMEKNKATAHAVLQIENGMWRNRRLSKELKFIAEKNFKRKQAGAKGGTQKQQNQEHSQQCYSTYTHTHTHTLSEEVLLSRARDLEAQLREAAALEHEPAPNLFVTGPLQALIDNGR